MEVIALTPAVQPRARIVGLDLARFVAAVGVVALHVGAKVEAESTSWLGPLTVDAFRWCVPLFFLVAGYLHFRGLPDAGTGDWVVRRALRLYSLYAAWTVIYLLAGSIVEPGQIPTVAEALLSGGGAFGFHLWFLPVLLLCGVVAAVLPTRELRVSVVLVCIALVAARLVDFYVPGDALLGSMSGAPFSHWLLLYVAGMLLAESSSLLSWEFPLALAAAVATFGAGFVHFATLSLPAPFPSVALFVTGAAGSLSLLPIALRLTGLGRVHSLFSTSLGVYLIHPMVRAAFARLLPLSSMSTPLWMVLTFGVVLGISLAVTMALQSWNATAWLVT